MRKKKTTGKENYRDVVRDVKIAHPNVTTAAQWNKLGDDYYFGNRYDQKPDFLLARVCFNQAIKAGKLDNSSSNLGDSLYRMAWLYEQGQGVVKNISKACEYYKKAVIQGHYQAAFRLISLSYSEFDTDHADDQWRELGDAYYFGNADKPQNYLLARACFKKAINLNAEDSGSWYSLGWIYQYGHGVKSDEAKALDYYYRAHEKGYFSATIQILLIDHPDLKGADDWFRIGQECSDPFAKACYKQAIKYDPEHSKASEELLWLDHKEFNENQWFKLGENYYSERNGGEIKYPNMARACYRLALQSNPRHLKSRKHLERDIILEILQRNGDINEWDDKHDTALHRAAKFKQLKNFARFRLMKADINVNNSESKKPFDYLDSSQINRVNTLQKSINILLSQLATSSPDIIINRIFLNREDKKKKTILLDRLNKFYRKPAIAPLLDLAKLAALGLHDNSNREKFSNNDYDSDDDDREKIEPLKSYLTITIDPTKENVDDIFHSGDDQKAYGLCIGNDILLGGRRNKPEKVRGTLIHELTHFVAQETFKNSSNPYFENDKTNIRAFRKIADDLEPKVSLNPILRGAFSQYYRNKKEIHAELIARISEMIIVCGLNEAKKEAPGLFKYYMNIFLEQVKKHVRKLEFRARSGWPAKLMTAPPSSEPYFFQEQEQEQNLHLSQRFLCSPKKSKRLMHDPLISTKTEASRPKV